MYHCCYGLPRFCSLATLSLLLGASPFIVGLLISLPESASGDAAEPLPHVDKQEQKAYTEKVAGHYKDESGQDTKLEAKFDMVPIPGGIFLMGSPSGEKGRDADEGPQHPVQIEPFWMGKCEVTWDEYDVYWKEVGLEGQHRVRRDSQEEPRRHHRADAALRRPRLTATAARAIRPSA